MEHGLDERLLRYIGREPIYRQYHHHEMTFAMAYAYSENFILPISHDEVVHGKGSMFERMPQDEWRKFGTLRAFYAFMWAHPGKKLLFMGTEFGQRREFSEARSVDWGESADWGHRGVQRLIKDMNGIYREHPAFWKLDTDASGFSWINADDRGGNVFSWLRFDGDGQMIACVTNFSTEPRTGLPDRPSLDRCLEGDFEHRRRCLRRHWADRQSRPGRRHRSPRPRISGVGGRDCATARRGLAAVRAGAGRRTRRAGEGGGRRTCQGTEAIAGARAVGVGVGVSPARRDASPRLDRGGRREGGEPGTSREPAARTSTRSRRPLFSRRPA